MFAALPLFVLGLAAADGVATPAPAPAPVADAAPRPTRVLVLDVAGDLEDGPKATLTNLMVARLSRFAALEVIAQKNVEKLLGLEAKKQMAGCEGDDTSCLAELAGAFNAEIVAAAQAGKLGGTTVFTLQFLDSKGVTVGRGSAQVSGLDDLASKVAEVVDGVGRDFTKTEPGDAAAAPSTAPTAAATAPPGLREPLLIGGGAALGVGVVVAGISVIPALLASGANNDLKGLRVRYIDAGRDDDLLAQAEEKQRSATSLTGLWNNFGLYGFWGGVLIGALGGGALAGSFALPAETPAAPSENP